MTTANTPANAHNLPDPMEEIDEGAISIASPRQLMWWKFRKHRIAVISVIVLIGMYLLALFAGFVSPYDPNTFNASYKYVPPMAITFLDGEGNFTGRPGVNGLHLPGWRRQLHRTSRC